MWAEWGLTRLSVAIIPTIIAWRKPNFEDEVRWVVANKWKIKLNLKKIKIVLGFIVCIICC